MPVDILLTVLATSVIQSIFGVGVLLFGTPLLLLLGYDFVNALSILLPISIAINSLQILKHYRYIDGDFFRHVLIYTIPFVVLFLFIATSSSINIGLLIGAFLIFVALKSFFPAVETMLQTLVRYEKAYLAAMGIVHGLTNLGGALLTAIVHGKQYDKNTTRVTVAVCYATFALFQLATLLALGSEFELSYAQNATFLQVGVIVFLLTEEIVYSGIDNNKYSKFFAAFLLASGLLLITKSI
ncbi:hypothetical protein Q9L42_005255 [Methylomarinum sp. Ch1-1]|uniref:Membrane transporter protein n=1 Tax=Methylomarinum roseum TaxID=3067653 RepID=A0AAU7NWV4_9GAMM|nr:hypothetical protein [Methylomarinum sp. Ch1-1]MDP4522390.1 hypothetical protein [Methylomarinum sp. Ch1-1]